MIDLRDWLPTDGPSFGMFDKTTVTIHWEGTLFKGDDPQAIERVASYHILKNWGTAEDPAYGNGIQYHKVFGRDGKVYQARDPRELLWHCGNAIGNAFSEAWMVRADPNNPVTDAQLESLRAALREDGRLFFPHSYWSSTKCPGDFLRSVDPGDDVSETQIREWAKEETRAVLANENWLKDLVTKAVHDAHQHAINGPMTTVPWPPPPPVGGAEYLGCSADFRTVFWFHDGAQHTYFDGVKIA